jgi:hypothetical protein
MLTHQDLHEQETFLKPSPSKPTEYDNMDGSLAGSFAKLLAPLI